MAAERDSDVRRLLILDDEAAVGTTIANIALSAGFEARALTDPEVFFHEMDAWEPSHIALDLVMPEVDGIEVLRRLGDSGCRASVIITSGVGSRVLEAARLSALEHGLAIAGVVSKPFTPAKFRTLLREGQGAVRPVPRSGRQSRNEVAITASMLETALARRELSLAYQPKILCASGAVAGFEALARWQHPEHGPIAPDRFVVAAEHLGLIDALTDHLFELALTWFTSALPEGETRLSFNISRRSLGDIGFADRLAGRCLAHGLRPQRVILEITETSALSDPTTSLDLLTRLRFKGFRLSIDDFGVGYSSIAQLARLPFSELKIDKSFVMSAATSAEARTIIRAMIGLAHGLELEVTAEGVEDEPALTMLREAGCDLAQGYHIARPMPDGAVPAWLGARPLIGTQAR